MAIEANLRHLRERISRTAEKTGRDPADITLVAVTKTVDVETIKRAIDCGVTIIGENRVREALAKHAEIGDTVEWHMVGHLQSRKAAQAVEIFDMVQSVDSVSTAAALQKRCRAAARTVRVLIEVNTSNEGQKYGVPPNEAESLIREIARMETLKIEGLMTMAPLAPQPELARPSFRQLRELAEKLRARDIVGVRLDVLSMGMTNDFEVAIEEGSNMVRVGTAIFGQ